MEADVVAGACASHANPADNLKCTQTAGGAGVWEWVISVSHRAYLGAEYVFWVKVSVNAIDAADIVLK